MVKKSNKKSEWGAAVLNFVLPGLGYVYVGKRMVFGIGLILTSVLIISMSFNLNMSGVLYLDSFLTALLLGYDAYTDAKEFNA